MRTKTPFFDSYFGINKKFQGIGLIISFDNAICGRLKHNVIEFKFLWCRAWIAYYFD